MPTSDPPAPAQATAAALLFSVVVPSLGSERNLAAFLDGIERQTLARERYEVIVVFDGAPIPPSLTPRLARLGVQVVTFEGRRGPPAARNAGARRARGEWLVSADDDVVPSPEWLERAAARIAAEPALDVIEGVTLKPGARPVRMHGDASPQYILCNLFVRRALFEGVGGFHEGYYDAASRVFFREDADLGYTLEGAGAKVGREPGATVTHPVEHPRYLDPLRWAKRYEMDALLAARYPELFRERIEIHQIGPFRIRRPIVRASFAYIAALVAAAAVAAFGHGGLALTFVGLALIAFLPIWAKWRFDLVRLPVYLLVPFALVAALVRGAGRVRRMDANAIGAPTAGSANSANS
ncbi:MAG: glycosyltransferase [Candidatus Eisenbacteria bacterium]|nr:glycosyltransferase [Candidatus Eisenbacteria bacterium]